MKSEDKEFDINGMVFWSGAYAYGAPALSDEVESVYQFFQREGLQGMRGKLGAWQRGRWWFPISQLVIKDVDHSF